MSSLRQRKTSPDGNEARASIMSNSSVANQENRFLVLFRCNNLVLIIAYRMLFCVGIIAVVSVMDFYLENKKHTLPITSDYFDNNKLITNNNVSVIPLPVRVTGGTTGDKTYFTITSRTTIVTSSQGRNEVVKYLVHDLLAPATGFELAVKSAKEKPDDNFISFHILSSYNPQLGKEGYLLEIKEKFIAMSANTPAGLFYAVQTLRQLLPPSIEARDKKQQLRENFSFSFRVPTMTIQDYPAYKYRGAMLDVSRHYFQVHDVKRFIDFLAMVKMNHFHIHLTDDQGWRIEIQKWPNLTTTGGSTQVGGGPGGYYTQEEYREIVQYAADRYITTVPEIDMPGHTNAALASYPELNCNPKDAPELYTGTKVGFSSLCIAKSITYTFVNDVIGEVAAMTPGPYLHIGGDEAHSTKKADYIQFVKRVQTMVKKHGKTMIGWDEVALAIDDSNAVVQFWNHQDLSQQAAKKQNIKVIVSPANKAYLDMKYDKKTRIGLHWSGYIDVDVGYKWKLEKLLPQEKKDSILGIEAPLWTETVVNMSDIEFLTFPRLLGYAEIGWSPAELQKWDTYKVRLGQFGKRMKVMGINFYPSKKVPWVDE